jgi:hypothetical protein
MTSASSFFFGCESPSACSERSIGDVRAGRAAQLGVPPILDWTNGISQSADRTRTLWLGRGLTWMKRRYAVSSDKGLEAVLKGILDAMK